MITSAKEATEIAMEFLGTYFVARKPLSAKRQNGTWVVKVDVGFFATEVATVEIDADDEQILLYDLPK